MCPGLLQKLKQTRLLGLHFIHYMFCLISSYHNLPDNSPVMWKKGEHEFLSNLFSLCFIIDIRMTIYGSNEIHEIHQKQKINSTEQTAKYRDISLLNVIRYVS